MCTLRYHKRAPLSGERVAENAFISGEPGIGKSAAINLLQKIQFYNKHYIDEYIKRWNLQFKRLEYDYLYTVSTYKLAVRNAKERNGQGIAFFVETSMFSYHIFSLLLYFAVLYSIYLLFYAGFNSIRNGSNWQK